MPFTPEAVTQQVQDRLKTLYSLTRDIDETRTANEPNISNLMKAREKIALGDDMRMNQQKIKTMLKQAITDTEKEEELLRKALSKIMEIRTIRNEYRIQVKNMFCYKIYYLTEFLQENMNY